MKDGRKYTIYLAIFIAVLLVPFAGMLITGPSASESDDAAKMPALVKEDGELNKGYLKDLGGYFEGHCALRKEMVTGYSAITSKVFGTSSSKSVICGKNGWMYYTDTLGDYSGSEVMSARQMNDCVRTLVLIDRYCKENGAKFVFVTAANKNSLYPDNMPYYYARTSNPGNRVLLGAKIKEAGINYVDLYDTFAGSGKVLYHKTDSHWNNEGAALASHVIHSATGTEHIDRYGTNAPYTIRKDFKGDLAGMMYPSLVPLEDEIYYNDAPKFSYVGTVESNFDNRIKTTGTGSKTLLMYRDSFGSALLPFMAEPYGNALFLRSLTMQARDFDNMKPDVVIMEKAERFLPQLASNPPRLPATEIKGNPVNVKELEGVDYKLTSANGYTTITGTLKAGTYGDDTRIYVGIDGHWYEAYPVCREDGEGFQLYVEEIAGGAKIVIAGSQK